jgi:hypothetical protein
LIRTYCIVDIYKFTEFVKITLNLGKTPFVKGKSGQQQKQDVPQPLTHKTSKTNKGKQLQKKKPSVNTSTTSDQQDQQGRNTEIRGTVQKAL